jgi:hypothetical protein
MMMPLASRLLAVLTLLLLVGCGASSDIQRVPVKGRVSYNNRPIENGEIRFFPIGDTRMPMSGAPIVNGEYLVTHRGGVPVGHFRVEVEGFRRGAPNPALDLEGGHREQYLPPKYNRSSELTAEVTSTADVVEIDFLDLKP